MPSPLLTRTGGRISSTLRPQCTSSPASGACWATPASHVSAARSSGAPRQWNALIGPLSSIRTRSRLRSRSSSRSATNPATLPCQLANASSSSGSFWPGAVTSAPWEPT